MKRDEIIAALDRVILAEEEVASAEAALDLARDRSLFVALRRVAARAAARVALGDGAAGGASGIVHAGSFWHVDRGELKRIEVRDTSDIIDVDAVPRWTGPRPDALGVTYSPIPESRGDR